MNGLSKISNFSLVSGIYPPDIGGPANYVPQFEKYLNEKGIQTTLISLADRPLDSKWQLNTKVFVKRGYFLPVRFVVTVFKLVRNSLDSDYVFANGLHEEMAIANLILRKKVIMKIVGDPVWEKYRNNSSGTFRGLIEFNGEKLKLKFLLRRKFLTWALNQADKIVCPSPELCELVASWGVTIPIIYIPNGVEPVEIKTSERPLDVIYAGRLVKWKNVDEVIKGIANIGLSLTVLGEGPERFNLEKLSESLGAKVKFEGQVPEAEIKDYLIKAKCFVLISDYEGMSFALLQAMNCGAVPVVSDIPGNLQIINHMITGIVVPLHDQEQLMLAFENAVKNATVFNDISTSAKDLCNREFNLERNFARMIELFELSA